MTVQLSRPQPKFNAEGTETGSQTRSKRVALFGDDRSSRLLSATEGTADGDASWPEPSGMSATAWLFESATFFQNY